MSQIRKMTSSAENKLKKQGVYIMKYYQTKQDMIIRENVPQKYDHRF